MMSVRWNGFNLGLRFISSIEQKSSRARKN
uniref:Uncharacterized protein n=1 Tax=Rhizophora mucronata TaxID=61149 RepID=A0A2P2Q3S8_RHIMU